MNGNDVIVSIGGELANIHYGGQYGRRRPEGVCSVCGTRLSKIIELDGWWYEPCECEEYEEFGEDDDNESKNG